LPQLECRRWALNELVLTGRHRSINMWFTTGHGIFRRALAIKLKGAFTESVPPHCGR